jgi:capsular polysaccharide biosynthesis protein
MEMDMDTEHNSYQDEEINLYDLWLILINKWLVILVVTLITAGLALVYAVLTPKEYRVHNVLVYNQMQDGELFIQSEIAAAISVLDKINKSTDLEKEKVLSRLGLHEKDLKFINNIKTTEIKGSSALWIDIDTKDRNRGVNLMEALPGLVLSNPNISNRIMMQRKLLIKNREDLKAIIDNPTKDIKLTQNAVVYVPSTDLFALRERYNSINALIEKIDRGHFVYLSWKTEPPIMHISPSKTKSVLIGLSLGCFLGIFIAFFMEWRKKVQHIHSKNLE